MLARPRERSLRKDAVRNRARLVDAAADLFLREGLGVSVNVIAAHAGVNIATLYRHFPAKDDLVDAVLETMLEPIIVARDRALGEGHGGRALATFLSEAVALQREHRGIRDALEREGAGTDVRNRLREPAIAIVTPIVERAHRDGDLREDFDALDLLVALQMIGMVAASGRLDRGGIDRYVQMLLRGLEPDPPS
jgi:AcrR family transcriptional regulator